MSSWRSNRLIVLVLSLTVFWISAPGWSLAAGQDIILDGNFSDWYGQTHMTDRTKDAFKSGDIIEFAWATNSDDSNLYFMIKRNRLNNVWDMAPAFYKVNLDMSDNGIYHNGNDRYLLVSYFPLDVTAIRNPIRRQHDTLYKHSDGLTRIHPQIIHSDIKLRLGSPRG